MNSTAAYRRLKKIPVESNLSEPFFEFPQKVIFYSKKALKTEVFKAFLGCRTDLNRRSYPRRRRLLIFLIFYSKQNLHRCKQ